jgi:transcription antitermination factor NusG
MPFLLHTIRGKESWVTRLLTHQGFAADALPLKGYVLCAETPPAKIQSLPQVLAVVEITPEEAQRLRTIPSPAQRPVTVGCQVRIDHDPYRGYTGMVHLLHGEMTTVFLQIWGKALPVTVPRAALVIQGIGEPWE